jgi:hypothetical protein
MAGQSVGMVTSEQPMTEIMEELVRQACAVFARQRATHPSEAVPAQ